MAPLPWCPLPRALLSNARSRMLSLDAVGALMLAWSLSDDSGVIQPGVDVTAREALVFIAVQHARESADPAVAPASVRGSDAVEELVEGGLLIVEGDALRLDGWVTLEAHAAASRAPKERTAPVTRKPGRPRKEVTLSPAQRKKKERFEARVRGFRDVPAGVTWEQWCAENPVTETPDGGHENYDAGHENPGLGHENPVTKTPARPRASGTEEKKRAEKKAEGDSGTRASGHENSGLGFRDQSPGSFRDQPRCPSVERAVFEVDVLLDQMRAASAGRFSSAAVATQMQAFGELARELIARGHATPESLVRAAGHAPHVPWVRKLSAPLTVQRLCADEGRVLIELLTGCATCAECGGDPLASGVIDVAAKAGDPHLDAIEAARAEWQRKYDEKQAAKIAGAS